MYKGHDSVAKIEIPVQTDDDCGTWTRVSGVTAMTPTSSGQSRSEIETNQSLYRRDTGFHSGQ